MKAGKNKERDMRIIKRSESGKSLRKISEEFGLSIQRVHTILKEAGLVPKRKRYKQRDSLSADRLRELITYYPESGIFIWNLRRPGKKAGHKDRSGYMTIGADGVLYKAHRLAWLYTYGEWPDGQIDHINRERSDNRIANLRVVTPQNNQRNRTLSRNNTSGFCGVYWDANRWCAWIKVNGKGKKIGRFKEKHEAVEARREAERRLGFNQLAETA